MDSDLVVFFLMLVFWLVSSLAARLGKKAQSKESASQQSARQQSARQQSTRAPEAPPPPGAPPEDALQNALQELAERMGLEVVQEQPVASEHTRSLGEHRPTATEARRTASEHRVRPSDHRQAAGERTRTASEAVFEPSEHDHTPGWHTPGDVVPDRLPPLPVARVRAALRSRFSRRLAADLRGPESLARAVVLREILGPPVGMRPPDGDQR